MSFISMKPTSPVFWNIVRLDALPANQDWLSTLEQTRYQQFRFPKKSQDWLSGRWAAKSLINTIFSERKPNSLDQLCVQNESSGAPFIEWHGKRLDGSLSISHRGGLAAAAYCPEPDVTIGIDLELIEAKSQGFVEDYFTAQEATWVLSLSEDQQALAASLLWSGREAILKAHKIGLRLDTRQIALKCPSFQSGPGWQPIAITHYPPELDHLTLFWNQIDQTIITLAIKQKHQEVEVSPDNFIQIL